MVGENSHDSLTQPGGEEPVTIRAKVLLDEVRRNRQQFHAALRRHDIVQIILVAVLMLFFLDYAEMVSWTGYLCAFGCFVVSSFLIVDRWRRRRVLSTQNDSLSACASASIADVDHQIWLRNYVFWWYLLPICVPVVIAFGAFVWNLRLPLIDARPIPEFAFVIFIKLVWCLMFAGFLAVANGGIYWLTRSFRRNHLEPRRRELERLLVEVSPEHQSCASTNNKPLRPLYVVLATCALAVIAKPFLTPQSGIGSSADASIETICRNNHLPALGVVVVKDGQICDRAVAGVRKWGDTTPVTTRDVFHIGSCTKSMTATLTAILIEEGKLNWDTTIANIFPELRGKMDARYESVTVEQLLHHRGGTPASPPQAAWTQARQEYGTPREQRRTFIENVLRAAPAATPGTRMIYSNQGYSIVGAMLEKICDQDFESLMTEKLFKPLHMDSAGFGPPGTIGNTDQPWGHLRNLTWTTPIQSDNPPAIAPAGRVHCSLDDLAKYAMLHLPSDTKSLLTPESRARLHASAKGVKPVGDLDDYACGWVRLRRDWAGGPVLWHNGSNTMWYTVMWLAPEKNFCVIAATNIADVGAQNGCNDASVAIIHKWLPEKTSKPKD